jgi:16S rRNA (cytosine1402-N4)-methyltransferase
MTNSESPGPEESPRPHVRRVRYSGKNPRKFSQKYKEHDPQLYPDVVAKVAASGKTPAGTHIPVLVNECLAALQLQPGLVGVDGTLGYGGHAQQILSKILPGGRLIGLDVDPLEQPKTIARLRAAGFGEDCFEAHRSNYAGIGKVLIQLGLSEVDFIFADLGCSSMQIDDPSRGFTFKDDGPLDMRMNPQRGMSAAEFLLRSDADQLSAVLTENADEPRAELIAHSLAGRTITSTLELVRALDAIVPDESHDTKRRVFQALRIAVNEEFTALDAFLRTAPHCLKAGGRIAILTFHSGEDRRVKKAFQQGKREGVYSAISDEIITASAEEKRANPRAIPAKLRWAERKSF